MKDQAEREPGYWLNEKQTILLLMIMANEDDATAATKEARHEMVEIIYAWRRGKLLSSVATPTLNKVFKEFSE